MTSFTCAFSVFISPAQRIGLRAFSSSVTPAALREQLEKMRNKEARREERAQQAAQQSAAEGEADKAE